MAGHLTNECRRANDENIDPNQKSFGRFKASMNDQIKCQESMVPGLGKRKTGLLKRGHTSQQNSQIKLESVIGSSHEQDNDFVGTAAVN